MEKKKLSYCQLLCIARVFFASFTGTISYFAYCTLEPTLALRLADYPVLT